MNLFKKIRLAYNHIADGIAEKKRQRLLQEQVFRDINKFLKKNCPKMASVEGYRKRLTRAINISSTHMSGLIDQIPGPIDLDPKQWLRQSALQSMFVKPEEIIYLLKSSKYLKRYFNDTDADAAYALLAATLNEKTVFTIEKNGDLLRRDVPRKAVYFADHEIFAPAPAIDACQFKIMHLALISLCRQVVQDTSGLQAWKKELEDQKNLLEFKLNAGSPDSDTNKETEETIQETKDLLTDIASKIKSINSQINVTDEHLQRIVQVFENPETHLAVNFKSLKLDRLGIRLDAASKERALEFSIAEFQFGQTPKMAGIWVRIKRDTMAKSTP